MEKACLPCLFSHLRICEQRRWVLPSPPLCLKDIVCLQTCYIFNFAKQAPHRSGCAHWTPASRLTTHWLKSSKTQGKASSLWFEYLSCRMPRPLRQRASWRNLGEMCRICQLGEMAREAHIPSLTSDESHLWPATSPIPDQRHFCGADAASACGLEQLTKCVTHKAKRRAHY